jgi:hypothetical protein
MVDPELNVHLRGIIGAVRAHIIGDEHVAIELLDAVNTELLLDEIEAGLETPPAVLYDQESEGGSHG